MNIGILIRKYRRARGMTQGELANALNTSVPHISNLETGKIIPKISTLERLAVALSRSTSDFLEPEVMTHHNPEFQKEEHP